MEKFHVKGAFIRIHASDLGRSTIRCHPGRSANPTGCRYRRPFRPIGRAKPEHPPLNSHGPSQGSEARPITGSFGERGLDAGPVASLGPQPNVLLRDVIRIIAPFRWGVEFALLVDVTRRVGLDRVAQVDLGSIEHDRGTLRKLAPQAIAVLTAALRRAGLESSTDEACPLLGFDEDHLMGMELVSVEATHKYRGRLSAPDHRGAPRLTGHGAGQMPPGPPGDLLERREQRATGGGQAVPHLHRRTLRHGPGHQSCRGEFGETVGQDGVADPIDGSSQRPEPPRPAAEGAQHHAGPPLAEEIERSHQRRIGAGTFVSGPVPLRSNRRLHGLDRISLRSQVPSASGNTSDRCLVARG